jgi:hypothetical protein
MRLKEVEKTLEQHNADFAAQQLFQKHGRFQQKPKQPVKCNKKHVQPINSTDVLKRVTTKRSSYFGRGAEIVDPLKCRETGRKLDKKECLLKAK